MGLFTQYISFLLGYQDFKQFKSAVFKTHSNYTK